MKQATSRPTTRPISPLRHGASRRSPWRKQHAGVNASTTTPPPRRMRSLTPAGTPPVHLDFNGAVANGLAGSWKQAEELLAAFTRRAGDHPGLEDLDRQAKKLIQRLGTPEFTVLVESWIAKRRANLKLGEPPVSLPSPGTSVAEAGAAPTRAPKR